MNLHRLIATLLLSAALFACPAEPPPPPEVEAGPEILSFTASADRVEAGASITLSWQTRNAKTVEVRDAERGVVSGGDALSGTADVVIVADSLFVLTAANERGVRETAAVVVSVEGAQPGVLLVATPTRALAGEEVVLAWSAPGARSVQLGPEGGEPIDLGAQKAFGSVRVAPSADTRYVLAADKRVASATVDVAPRIEALVAAPSPAERGAQLRLSWKTAGATRVTVSGAGRGQLAQETSPSRVADGSFAEVVPATADPASALSYVLRAYAEDGDVTERPITVYVGGAPAVAEWNVPAFAPATLTFQVSWATSGADVVEILKGEVPVYRSPTAQAAAAGTLTLATPDSATAYTLRAMDSRGVVALSEPKVVDPVGLPNLIDFQVTPLPGIANGGEPVTISWEIENARHVRIVAVGQFTVADIVGTQAAQGTVTAYPNKDTEYVLTADNGIGNQLPPQSAQVTVGTPARFNFSPPSAPVGATVSVTSSTVPNGGAVTGLPMVVLNAPGEAFIDISATGVDTNYSGPDTTAKLVTLPEVFTFRLFGQTISGDKLSYSPNGWFVFRTTTLAGPDLPQPFPTTALDPFSIAPVYEDLYDTSVSEVFYQLDDLGTEKRLILQWDQFEWDPITGSTVTFQAQLYSSGKVVFAYGPQNLVSTANPSIGIVNGDETDALVFDGFPVEGDTITFFGTATLPADIRVGTSPIVARQEMPGGGFVEIEQGYPYISLGQFTVTEVNVDPAPGVTAGQWFEVKNNSAVAIDLAGWTLDFGAGGSHTIATSTLLPASGYLVFAQSPNAGDGVTVDYAYGSGFTIPSGGAAGISFAGFTYTSLGPPAGASLVPGRSWQFGPVASGMTTVAGTTTLECAGRTAYGTNGQKGTPGAANTSCPSYAYSGAISGNFEAIAGSGTQISFTNLDDDIATVNLPVPLTVDGLSFSSIVVGTNGFISLFPLTCTDQYCFSGNKAALNPATQPVGLIAPFWDDNDLRAAGGVYWERKTGYTIVSWENVHHFYDPAAANEDLNFQVKFFDTGDMEFHYGDMTGTGTGTTAYHTGVTATTWWEHPSGRAAFIVNVNSATAPGITSNTGFRLAAQ